MTDSLSRPAQILRDLIRCPSVTPAEGGALDLMQNELERLGFAVHRMTFRASGTPDVENLYARYGTAGPNLCFAGHTDVVPVGDADAWSHSPFGGDVIDGVMFGRGAVDMKGGVACFLAAAESFLRENSDFAGSISFLITGDEEGPAVNGTLKVLDWLEKRGETLDACILGEPTNPDVLGDAIKIGRRGSVSGTITVNGVQGHAAYPHLADNPVRGVVALCRALMAEPFDDGTKDFQPTNLEVTSIDVGNPATNVIPARARAAFNVRFNDTWSAESIQAEIVRRLVKAAKDDELRPALDSGSRPPVAWSIEWAERPSHVFLTHDHKLIETLAHAVEAVTGRKPELSTGGGTSDARFIKDACPVVEFGLVGQTMHQVDERVELADLDRLTDIYRQFLSGYFSG